MINDFNREELQTVLTQLDQALHDHSLWYNKVIRTIACKLHPDKHDVCQDPQRQCQFGQWYYEYSFEKLRVLPQFSELGEAHSIMHKLAAELLVANQQHTIDVHDYDNFSNSVERLEIEIASLRRDVETALYTHDPLTGAINRLDMLRILRELYEMGKRDAMSCTVIMIDLDNFKNINDEYGHIAGDKVLVAVSHYIMKSLRNYDKMFRYGGEEFIVCLLQTDITEAYKRIEEIRTGLSNLKIDIDGIQPVTVTASFGITILDSNITLEQNIEHADAAMYLAKKNGRNCTKIWSKENCISK